MSHAPVLWPRGPVGDSLELMLGYRPTTDHFVDVIVDSTMVPLPVDGHYRGRVKAIAEKDPLLLPYVYTPKDEDFDFLWELEEENDQNRVSEACSSNGIYRRNKRVYGIIKIHDWNLQRLANIDTALQEHEMDPMLLVQGGNDLYVVLEHNIPESFIRCMMLTKWLSEAMVLPLKYQLVEVLSTECPFLREATTIREGVRFGTSLPPPK